jgi:hypothetical protein
MNEASFMNLDSTVFLLGIIGGALAELLKWYQLRESPNFPVYATTFRYWLITALMIIAGGILAVVHGVNATEPLLAVNIGVSAPLIIKGLAAVAQKPKSRGDRQTVAGPSRWDFLAGR